MATSNKEPLCPDWVVIQNINVHVAKDRGWFTSYTPFQSTLGPLYSDESWPVVGVGTVMLSTPPAPGSPISNVLRLENVLHVPSFFCNAIGCPLVMGHEYNFSYEGNDKTKGAILDSSQQPAAYFLPGREQYVPEVLAPRGETLGPTVFQPDAIYSVSCEWSEEERQKWEEHQKAQTLEPKKD
ncbi:Nn.00g027150.m01.CDS01 [Neocucurbitaria sp. VM-36]